MQWKGETVLAKKEKSFEERLTDLEELVSKMEQGSMPLDETLTSYEQGTKLAKKLLADLQTAEKKLLELKDGKLVPLEETK